MLASAVLLALVSLATAQSFNISNVDLPTRDQWCQSQQTSCPLICLQLPGVSGTPSGNTCDPQTLDYSCICSNGQSPNASEYTQTIPYFICTETNLECSNNCNGVSTCQSACIQNNPCGAQNPTRGNTTTTAATTTTATTTPSATGSSTGNGTVLYTGFGSASTGTPKSVAGPSINPVEIGQVYGLCMLVAGLLAGFAVML